MTVLGLNEKGEEIPVDSFLKCGSELENSKDAINQLKRILKLIVRHNDAKNYVLNKGGKDNEYTFDVFSKNVKYNITLEIHNDKIILTSIKK